MDGIVNHLIREDHPESQIITEAQVSSIDQETSMGIGVEICLILESKMHR
jgi:hypothetical protein